VKYTLIPNWDKTVFWNNQTLGENVALKKRSFEQKSAEIFEKAGVADSKVANQSVFERVKEWFS
jgi:hypothetical protein